MLTFEQFIAEADEMTLQSRVAAGQITPQQAQILKQRREKRAKVTSTNPEQKSSVTNKPSISGIKPKASLPGTTTPKLTGTKERPALPGTASNYKPQPVTKANNDLGPVQKRKPIPNHLALSTKVKKPDPTQTQRSNILNAKPSIKDKRRMAKISGGLKKARDFLKKRPEETPSIQIARDLEGPQVFGPGTR